MVTAWNRDTGARAGAGLRSLRRRDQKISSSDGRWLVMTLLRSMVVALYSALEPDGEPRTRPSVTLRAPGTESILEVMQIPIIPDSKLALFLDVDGTLLEIAETPHSVAVPDSLKLRLHTLSARLHGAFALVSGRSVEMLDRLFAPHRFTAAGIHGS